jgi:hypothetical protein
MVSKDTTTRCFHRGCLTRRAVEYAIASMRTSHQITQGVVVEFGHKRISVYNYTMLRPPRWKNIAWKFWPYLTTEYYVGNWYYSITVRPACACACARGNDQISSIRRAMPTTVSGLHVYAEHDPLLTMLLRSYDATTPDGLIRIVLAMLRRDLFSTSVELAATVAVPDTQVWLDLIHNLTLRHIKKQLAPVKVKRNQPVMPPVVLTDTVFSSTWSPVEKGVYQRTRKQRIAAIAVDPAHTWLRCQFPGWSSLKLWGNRIFDLWHTYYGIGVMLEPATAQTLVNQELDRWNLSRSCVYTSHVRAYNQADVARVHESLNRIRSLNDRRLACNLKPLRSASKDTADAC